MPYIDSKRREALKVYERVVLPETAGELNYCVTRIVDRMLGDSPRYDDMNSIIGALEACKLELYRRVISPYEDVKIKANGDAYQERD